jgi:hypothetical protein
MIFEKPQRQTERSALPSADNVESLKRTCAFALLLFAFPAGVLTNLNTTRKEELRVAPGHAMEGRAGAAVVAEVVTGEILAAHETDLAARKFVIGRQAHAAFCRS